MMILVIGMFLLVLVLVSLYLYVHGVFNTSYLRAYQCAFYILMVCFALTIGIGIQHFYEGYDRPATTPLSLSEVPPEP
jgi:hypothetical protein